MDEKPVEEGERPICSEEESNLTPEEAKEQASSGIEDVRVQERPEGGNLDTGEKTATRDLRRSQRICHKPDRLNLSNESACVH